MKAASKLLQNLLQTPSTGAVEGAQSPQVETFHHV
jgi:hypothetical protein